MKASKIRGGGARPIRNSRWLAYTAASAATALAGEHATEGAVHYSGLIDRIFPGFKNLRSTFSLDRPGDALVFEHLQTTHFAQTHFAGFKAVGRLVAYMRGFSGESYARITKLNPGSFISQGHFITGYANFSGFGTLAGHSGGYFGRGIGYVGFKFNSGAGNQYGWARVLMAGHLRGNGFKLLDYAYADPGEAIQVGQTSDDAPVSGMGSLGLLAAGAAGLVAWRGRRKR